MHEAPIKDLQGGRESDAESINIEGDHSLWNVRQGRTPLHCFTCGVGAVQ